MKNIITILFTFLSISLFAQVEFTVQKKSFGFGLNVKNTTLISDESLNAKNGTSYSLEGNLFIEVGKNFFFKTGADLVLLNASVADYGLRLGCDHDGMGGFLPGNSFIENELNWVFIGIPAEFQINFFNKKNRLYWKLGAEVLVNVFNRNRSVLHECGVEGNPGDGNFYHTPRRLNGQFLLGFGYEFSINLKTKVFVEPNMEYIFTNTLSTKTLFEDIKKSKARSIGLKVGVRF